MAPKIGAYWDAHWDDWESSVESGECEALLGYHRLISVGGRFLAQPKRQHANTTPDKLINLVNLLSMTTIVGIRVWIHRKLIVDRRLTPRPTALPRLPTEKCQASLFVRFDTIWHTYSIELIDLVGCNEKNMF
jgi:hypothetical protein